MLICFLSSEEFVNQDDQKKIMLHLTYLQRCLHDNILSNKELTERGFFFPQKVHWGLLHINGVTTCNKAPSLFSAWLCASCEPEETWGRKMLVHSRSDHIPLKNINTRLLSLFYFKSTSFLFFYILSFKSEHGWVHMQSKYHPAVLLQTAWLHLTFFFFFRVRQNYVKIFIANTVKWLIRLHMFIFKDITQKSIPVLLEYICSRGLPKTLRSR